MKHEKSTPKVRVPTTTSHSSRIIESNNMNEANFQYHSHLFHNLISNQLKVSVEKREAKKS